MVQIPCNLQLYLADFFFNRAGRFAATHCVLTCSDLYIPLNYPHQQQPWFPSETPGCSGRLWRLWRNLVPSDGELLAACRPGDGSRCTAQHLGAPATNLWASGSTSNHSRAFWEKQHLGMLLVRVELIATTNRATIFKTHVFRLYSHLCI